MHSSNLTLYFGEIIIYVLLQYNEASTWMEAPPIFGLASNLGNVTSSELSTKFGSNKRVSFRQGVMDFNQLSMND